MRPLPHHANTAAAVTATHPVACEKTMVLSRDAKYMLLDAETLRVADVGNLW